MKVLNIGIDLDGTIADWSGSLIKRIKKLWRLNIKDLYKWDIYEICKETAIEQNKIFNVSKKEFYDRIYNKNFWRNIKPIGDIKTSIKKLSKYGNIYIVSIPAEWNYCPGEKREWLKEHLKGIDYTLILTQTSKSKGLLNLDIMIDDSPKVIDAFKGTGTTIFVPKRTWNKYYLEQISPHRDILPIDSIEEVVETIEREIDELRQNKK